MSWTLFEASGTYVQSAACRVYTRKLMQIEKPRTAPARKHAFFANGTPPTQDGKNAISRVNVIKQTVRPTIRRFGALVYIYIGREKVGRPFWGLCKRATVIIFWCPNSFLLCGVALCEPLFLAPFEGLEIDPFEILFFLTCSRKSCMDECSISHITLPHTTLKGPRDK